MSPDDIFRVARYVFAFLGFFSLVSALGWLYAAKNERREKLRALPAAGKIGELIVLAGSNELPAQTWFPVAREGVLGSVRSCDLVVPCPGVKAHHLDYVWNDGIGLIVCPRSGCEVRINGVLLDCRSDASLYPLTHGSCLQVGEAVLRLQVLKALDHTYAAVDIAPVPEPASVSEVNIPLPEQDMPYPYYPPVMPSPGPVPAINPVSPPENSVSYSDAMMPPADMIPHPETIPPASPVQSVSSISRPPRRSDRWKEDWGE